MPDREPLINADYRNLELRALTYLISNPDYLEAVEALRRLAPATRKRVAWPHDEVPLSDYDVIEWFYGKYREIDYALKQEAAEKWAAEQDSSGCFHPILCIDDADGKPLPRYPLLYGSTAVQVCAYCGWWRMLRDGIEPWRPGPYQEAYEAAMAEDEE